MRTASLLVAMAALLNSARAYCVMNQTCPSAGQNGCVPGRATDPEPFVPASTILSICPQYSSSACCNPTQISQLQTSALLLNVAFNLVGGCTACYANLMEFWCAFTCSPEQHKFMEVMEIQNVTQQGFFGPVTFPVRHIEMLMDAFWSCSVTASCSDTDFFKEDSNLQICESMWNFFGSGAQALQHGTNITFSYVKAQASAGPVVATAQGRAGRHAEAHQPDTIPPLPSGVPTLDVPLSRPWYSCCSFPINMSDPSAGNTSCPCSACSGVCGTNACYGGITPAVHGNGNAASVIVPNLGVVNHNIFDGGINFIALPIYYALLVGLTGVYYLWRYLKDRR